MRLIFLESQTRTPKIIAGLELPTNQFRLGESFKVRVTCSSEDECDLKYGYLQLQCRELLYHKDTGTEGPDDSYWESKTIHRNVRPLIGGRFGPGHPAVSEVDFTIPVDVGWTIPDALEWELVAFIDIDGGRLTNTYGLTVLPIVLQSPLSVEAVSPEHPIMNQASRLPTIKTDWKKDFTEAMREKNADKLPIHVTLSVRDAPTAAGETKIVEAIRIGWDYIIDLVIKSGQRIDLKVVRLWLKCGKEYIAFNPTTGAYERKNLEIVPGKPLSEEIFLRLPASVSPTIAKSLIRRNYQFLVEVIVANVLRTTGHWMFPILIKPGITYIDPDNNVMPFTAWRKAPEGIC